MRYGRALAITERHEKLIELIRSGEFSSTQLARKLKVSEQTIYRDIDHLNGLGHLIRSVRLATSCAYQLASESLKAAEQGGSQ